MENSTSEYSFTYRSFATALAGFSVISFFLAPTQGVIWVNGWNTGLLDVFFATITHLGNGLVFIPFVVILYFFRPYWSIALMTSGVLQALAITICKRVIFPFANRPITELNHDLVHFVDGVEVYRAHSFPSGHTATIFGVCIFVALCFRSRLLCLILLVISVSVGLSRIYLLEHYFVDVAVGGIQSVVASFVR